MPYREKSEMISNCISKHIKSSEIGHAEPGVLVYKYLYKFTMVWYVLFHFRDFPTFTNSTNLQMKVLIFVFPVLISSSSESS